MLQKLSKRFNDERLLVLTGLIISIYPICFLAGSMLINLNTLIICVIFIVYYLKTKNFYIFRNKYFILLVLLWISFLINLIFSSNFENSLSRVLGFTRFILLAITIKIFFEISSKELQKTVFKIWLISFVIISFDLIFEYITGFNILGFSSPMPGRLSGFLNQELKIGHLYSAFFLICSVNILAFTKKRKILFLFILFSVLVSILIGERSNSIRVLLMSVFFIFLFENKDFTKKIISLLISTLIIILIISLNNEYKKRYWDQFTKPILLELFKTDIGEIKENSNFKRIINFSSYGANFDRGYRVYLENKIFGVGIKNYRNESNKEKYENNDLIFNKTAANIHPHQVHLEFLAETGLFGYFSFFIFIIVSLYWGYKNFAKSKKLIIFSSFLFIIFSLIPFLPTGSFFTTYGATLFWINYGLMINESNH